VQSDVVDFGVILTLMVYSLRVPTIQTFCFVGAETVLIVVLSCLKVDVSWVIVEVPVSSDVDVDVGEDEVNTL